jgi:hypothetical protein
MLTSFGVNLRLYLRQRLKPDIGRTVDVLLDYPTITVTKGAEVALQGLAPRRLELKGSILSIGMVALKVLLVEHFDTLVELKPIVALIDPEPIILDASGALAPLSTRSTNPTIKPFSSRYVDLSVESSDEDESDSEGLRVSGKGPQVFNSTQTTLKALPQANIPLTPLNPTSNATRNQLLSV